MRTAAPPSRVHWCRILSMPLGVIQATLKEGCSVNVSDLAGEAPSTHGGSEDEDGGTTISATLVPDPLVACLTFP